MKIKLAIVDDEELFRIGITYILSKDEALDIVFQGSNGQELLDYLRGGDNLPDIIMMDIKMPVLNGVEATKIIQKEFKDIHIIALTTYGSKQFIRNMISVGACAYLVKNSSPDRVSHTIKQVFYNGFYYDEQVIDILGKRFDPVQVDDKSLFDSQFLTPREREILELICQQNTTSEIGQKLYISSRTVDIHRKNLLQKAGVKNSAGLVAFAISNNLVKPLF